MFLLTFLISGIGIGYFQGGKKDNLSLVEFKRGSLVLIALGVQVVLLLSSAAAASPVGLAAHVASYALVIAFLLINRHIRWTGTLAAGVALNLVATLAQHNIVPGAPMMAASASDAAAHAAVLASTLLWFLGDVLPMPPVVFPSAISIGDLTVGISLYSLAREMLLARALRTPEFAISYEPKHLARESRRLLLTRRAV